MPIIWMGFSTASPPEVHDRRDDPVALRAYVAAVVERAGAKLDDLYFEVGADRACALIDGLDDYVAAKAVARTLGADRLTKLVRAEQAAEAVTLANDLRGSSTSGA
jgi:hypothetical protein